MQERTVQLGYVSTNLWLTWLANAPVVRTFPDGSSCLEHDGVQVMLLRSLGLCAGCPSAWGVLSQILAWPPSPLLGITSSARPSPALWVKPQA